jgi:hypothetical protein
MLRWLSIVVLAGLAACSSDRDPERYRFGVSGDRLVSEATPQGDQAMRVYLDAKARQICTLGYSVGKVDTLAATDSHQIVDLELLCNEYGPSLGGVSLDDLF